MTPGETWRNARPGIDVLPTPVAHPSFYRTFVFVMPRAQIEQLLGGLSTRVAPQEFREMGGDVSIQATNAIYVSPDELQNRSVLVQQLTFAVGLKSLPDGPRVDGTRPTPAERVYMGRYPGFAFCVQAVGVDPGLEVVAKASLETALSQMIQDPDWKLLRRDSVPPIVDAGCPSDPLVARPGVKFNGGRPQGNIDQYNVATASFYQTFVFIMSPEQIHSLLGGLSIRLAPQEIVWAGGDVAGEETNAIFVAPEELADSPFLVKQLTFAVGLESPDPE